VNKTKIVSLNVDKLETNQLSGNEEDGSTFKRLKKELSKYGMVELPVVVKTEEAYRIIAGHHRIKAWKELGNSMVDCMLIEGEMSKEEEFNLVNNLNQIKGNLTLSRLKRIIRYNELDVTKLDVFKVPITNLIPSDKAVEKESLDAEMRARIRDLSLKLASEIAELVLMNKNESIIMMHKEGKIAAILHIKMPISQARAGIPVFKGIIEKALDEMDKSFIGENVQK